MNSVIRRTTASDHSISSRRSKGVTLYVRERTPRDAEPSGLSNAVLFIHGTFHPGCGFDCSAPGYSWLADLAAAGIPSYYLDLRGYGRSRVSPDISTILHNKPLCTIDEAVLDVSEAVDFICDRLAIRAINLVGYSWGTQVASRFAQTNPDKVKKVMLLAPLTAGGRMAHTDQEPSAPDPAARIFGRGFDMLCDPDNPAKFNPAVGAFTRWSIADARRHDMAAMKGLDPAMWQVPEVGGAALADLQAATGERGDLVTSPSGAAFNLFQFYVQGHEHFDPHEVECPILITRGDHDFANTGEGVLELLSRFRSRQKASIEIGNAGHGVFRHKAAATLFALSRAFFQMLDDA